MKKSLIAISLAAAFALSAPLAVTENGAVTGYKSAVAADAGNSADYMKRLNLIIKKLRDAMGSMKDFDELEKAGLNKRDVDRMRHAMEEKINQMMEDAIYAIRNL
ncbi:hypothetical protein [Mariprofundus erugo]|uniref:hypothetical protein n=1 Tax=Mariprofundus erugo TaxID=2528639 RepID=UPI001EE783BA|nr:hypothetical protein [Mariprofundus erugo]